MDFPFTATDLVTGKEVSGIERLWVTEAGSLIATIILDGNTINVPAKDIEIQPKGF